MFNDPTGHCLTFIGGNICVPDPNDPISVPTKMTSDLANMFDDQLLEAFGVTTTGGWTQHNKDAVVSGVIAEGLKLAQYTHTSPSDAFKQVYQGVTFNWNPECPGCRSQAQNAICSDYNGTCASHGAVTHDSHNIQFASMASGTLSARNNVVHELGHALNGALGGQFSVGIDEDKSILVFLQRYTTGSKNGFASESFPWQQAVTNVNTGSEIFADMNVGWVFDTWENNLQGQQRAIYMDVNMARYLNP